MEDRNYDECRPSNHCDILRVTPVSSFSPACLRVTDYSGLETAFITAHRLLRRNRRGIGENDERRVSLLGLRLPVIDDRDGRGGAFVHGEIHQEALAVVRYGVLLLAKDRHGPAGNANRKQCRWSPAFNRLPIW